MNFYKIERNNYEKINRKIVLDFYHNDVLIGNIYLHQF